MLVVGRGNGTFDVRFRVAQFSLGAVVDVTAADFDENGSNDLAVTSILPGAIRILLNACVEDIPALSPMALLVLGAAITAAGLLILRR